MRWFSWNLNMYWAAICADLLYTQIGEQLWFSSLIFTKCSQILNSIMCRSVIHSNRRAAVIQFADFHEMCTNTEQHYVQICYTLKSESSCGSFRWFSWNVHKYRTAVCADLFYTQIGEQLWFSSLIFMKCVQILNSIMCRSVTHSNRRAAVVQCADFHEMCTNTEQHYVQICYTLKSESSCEKYGYKFTYAAKQTVALTAPIFTKFNQPNIFLCTSPAFIFFPPNPMKKCRK